MVIIVIKVSMIKKIFCLEVVFSLAIAVIGVRLGYVQILRNNVLLGRIVFLVREHSDIAFRNRHKDLLFFAYL